MILRQLSTQDLQLQKLIEIYRRAEIQIEKELTRKRALDLVDFAEQAALKRVQQTLAEMTRQAEEQAPIAIESFFDTTAEALTTTKTNVVNTLVNNYMGKIDEAAEVTFNSAKEFLAVGRLAADEFRTLSLERVAEATAIGKGWRDAQRKLAIDLNNKGITAFTDKAGRQWDLTGYCSMLTRTTARQAQVAATLTENDHDLWQILPHGTTCALCAAYQGRVYSKSGLDPDYPPLSSAFGKIDPLGANDLTNTYLNIHPNCLCTLAPYTTAGKTDEEIQEDKDFSSFEKRPANVDYRTEQQRDEYRAKEKARAEYRNTKKQFEKYKAAGVDDMPVRLSTFEKHKKANDDVYKGWERKFRQLNLQSKQITSEIESDIIKADSEEYKRLKDLLKRDNVKDNPVKAFETQPTRDEIITRLGGGDMTKGSCSSLAFAYCGNVNGLDVIDFRGGNSQEFFGQFSHIQDIAKLPGVQSNMYQVKRVVNETLDILQTLPKNKEYYLAVSKHAAIIRKADEGLQYLELQSKTANKNGWKALEKETLRWRFGCPAGVRKFRNIKLDTDVTLIDVESFKGNSEFQDILGYINTAVDKQKKGVLGDVK